MLVLCWWQHSLHHLSSPNRQRTHLQCMLWSPQLQRTEKQNKILLNTLKKTLVNMHLFIFRLIHGLSQQAKTEIITQQKESHNSNNDDKMFIKSLLLQLQNVHRKCPSTQMLRWWWRQLDRAQQLHHNISSPVGDKCISHKHAGTVKNITWWWWWWIFFKLSNSSIFTIIFLPKVSRVQMWGSSAHWTEWGRIIWGW